jgi:hypothetical protein
MSSGCISWKRSKRWHLQRGLAVGLAMGVLSLGGETAFGQSSRSGWSFCIQVYDPARVSPGTLASAFHVAGGVLLAAGVPTEWHSSLTGVENSEGRSCLILSVTRGVSRNASSEALGFVSPNTHGAPDVTILYDRVARLEMLPVSVGASMPQILGYAMAHEIGHVLLGSTEHSSEGIMRSHWNEAELERLAKGWLGFTSQQSAVMRKNAFRRATLQQPQSAKAKAKSEDRASHLDVETSESTLSGGKPHG